MQTFSCFGMLGSSLLVANLQCMLVERLGLCVTALFTVEVG